MRDVGQEILDRSLNTNVDSAQDKLKQATAQAAKLREQSKIMYLYIMIAVLFVVLIILVIVYSSSGHC